MLWIAEKRIHSKNTGTILSMEERFLKHINKTETCWEWIGSKNKHGYGRFYANGMLKRAHRVAYELWRTTIPEGLIVRHMCDNPSCVNPDHLELGTQRDNMNDMTERNRQAKGDKSGARLHPEKVARGDKHYSAKLTEDDVKEILILRDFDFTQTELAKRFNVSQATIGYILRGDTWKHITRNQ